MQLTDELVRLRGTVDRMLTVALWLHVPLIAGVAWFLGNPMLALGGSAAAIAGLATAAVVSWPEGSGDASLSALPWW